MYYRTVTANVLIVLVILAHLLVNPLTIFYSNKESIETVTDTLEFTKEVQDATSKTIEQTKAIVDFGLKVIAVTLGAVILEGKRSKRIAFQTSEYILLALACYAFMAGYLLQIYYSDTIIGLIRDSALWKNRIPDYSKTKYEIYYTMSFRMIVMECITIFCMFASGILKGTGSDVGQQNPHMEDY